MGAANHTLIWLGHFHYLNICMHAYYILNKIPVVCQKKKKMQLLKYRSHIIIKEQYIFKLTFQKESIYELYPNNQTKDQSIQNP